MILGCWKWFNGVLKEANVEVTDANKEKLDEVIHKAVPAVELGDGEKAEVVTKEVVRLLQEKFRDQTPSVEDAQDMVIQVLRKSGYEKVAVAYEDFREKKEELRALRGLLGIEPKLTVNAMEVLKARELRRG